MGLEDKLREDLKDAMRKGEKVRLSVLRLALSAASYAQMSKGGQLSDADIIGVLAKQAKQREESIEAFNKGGRADLAENERAELAVLRSYLPQQLTHDEVVEAARAVIVETGAKGPQDKSKVMPKLVAQLKGKADGREINSVVTELLGGK
ncbi:MAG: GatB/YqeY domain-containing protein [Chloroflexi bacterium]|nr:GatB/YqeY domain-containing protein [Chloroflexota bacterium]